MTERCTVSLSLSARAGSSTRWRLSESAARRSPSACSPAGASARFGLRPRRFAADFSGAAGPTRSSREGRELGNARETRPRFCRFSVTFRSAGERIRCSRGVRIAVEGLVLSRTLNIGKEDASSLCLARFDPILRYAGLFSASRQRPWLSFWKHFVSLIFTSLFFIKLIF